MTPDPRTDELLAVLRLHGVLGAAEVVDVEHLHQRSRCYHVTLSDGRAVFAKQAQQNAAGRWTADVVGEGTRMRQLASLPSLRPLVPAVLALDPHRRLLVTESLRPAITLDDARREGGGTDPVRAAALGRALGAVHSASVDGLPLPVVDQAGLVVTSWSRVTPRTLSVFPDGYREVAVLLQRGDFLDQLAGLSQGWRTDTLVHGDVKSDNVLCDMRPTGRWPVRLIDWECAGLGDARWDVGSAIGDYLFHWLRSMTVTPEGGLSQWLATASPSLADVRVEIAALTEGYSQSAARRPDEAEMTAWMRYAGMFLIHRLTMAAMHAVALGAHSLSVLQVGRQFVRSPHTALEVLAS